MSAADAARRADRRPTGGRLLARTLRTGAELAFDGAGWSALALTGYLTTTAVAAFGHRSRTAPATGTTRIAVLIPAHNEAGAIEHTISHLLAQSYPRHLTEIVVLADNCTDDTEAVAVAAGADRVLVRDMPDLRGKGHALRWAFDRILAEPSPPEAFVIVDADSIAQPQMLERLVAELEAGADAVQGDDLMFAGESDDAWLRVAAFILVNRVRQAGRSTLRQSALLCGTGMLLSRRLVTENPWSAFTSAEDLEYTIDLRLAGFSVAFAPDAHVISETAPTSAATTAQQTRWEGGRLNLMRLRGREVAEAVVRDRRFDLVSLLVEVVMPPLGMLAGASFVGAVVETLAPRRRRRSIRPWRLAACLLPAYVLVGLRAGRAPGDAYRALARAPAFVARKPAALLGVVRLRTDSWVRTERAHEQPTER